MTHTPRNPMKLSVHLLTFLAALALILTGCRNATVVPLTGAASPKLQREMSIYIMTPQDGRQGDTQFPGSGDSVVAALQAALSHYVMNVVVGSPTETKTDALEAARTKRCTYLISPQITRWEIRPTKWSGLGDQVELTLKVVSVEDGVELRSAQIKEKSSWATTGANTSQELMNEPVAKFVTTLFE